MVFSLLDRQGCSPPPAAAHTPSDAQVLESGWVPIGNQMAFMTVRVSSGSTLSRPQPLKRKHSLSGPNAATQLPSFV